MVLYQANPNKSWIHNFSARRLAVKNDGVEKERTSLFVSWEEYLTRVFPPLSGRQITSNFQANS